MMYNAIYFINESKLERLDIQYCDELIYKYENEFIDMTNEQYEFKPNRASFIEKEGVILLDFDESVLNEYDKVELRAKRNIECFPIINRGKLWYDKLTQEQLEELDKWYSDWLNVTETLEEPVKPEWIK